MNRMKVSFCLIGDKNSNLFDGAVITDALGIQPTVIRLAKDFPQASIKAGVAHNYWCFSIELCDCWGVPQCLMELRNQLSDKISIINSLIMQENLISHIEISLHSNLAEMPELSLSCEDIFFLAQIGADIGIDPYFNEDEQ